MRGTHAFTPCSIDSDRCDRPRSSPTAERGLSRHSLGVLARRIRAGEPETVSLAILPEIDHAFTAVVGNWQRLLESRP